MSSQTFDPKVLPMAAHVSNAYKLVPWALLYFGFSAHASQVSKEDFARATAELVDKLGVLVW